MSFPNFFEDPKSRRRRSAVKVETLEGRALLSHMHVSAQAVAPPVDLQAPVNPHPGPILNKLGVGYAVKSPRFYPFYTGVKRTELNAAGAKAALDGQGDLVLTGIVVANSVPQSPTSSDQEAFYFFGINRGGATTPGPIPGRPGITFDALVEVDITQSGISAFVLDTGTGQTTDLPDGSLLFKQNALQVTVPLSMLPSTGATADRYTVAFAAGSAPSTGGPETIASFAPEFRNFPVAAPAFALQPIAATSAHHHRAHR